MIYTHRNLENNDRELYCLLHRIPCWNVNCTWIYANVRPNLGWRLFYNVGVWPDFPRLFIESKFKLDQTLFRRNNILAEDTRRERARIDIFEPISRLLKPTAHNSNLDQRRCSSSRAPIPSLFFSWKRAFVSPLNG